MSPDPDATDPAPETPAKLDPAALKGAHGRTGRMFKNAGLPFEDDEFDKDDDEHEDSSASSSLGDDADAPTSS